MLMKRRLALIPVAVGTALVLAFPATALAKPTKTGTESFVSVQDINGNGGGPVSATGVINDNGTDVVVSDTQDTFVFSDGQITVFHSPLKQIQHFNKGQCSFSFTEKGTYVFGDGTGVWAGYNGSGSYTVSGSAVDACTGPGIGSITINATGPINLSSG
jgi:hypothetical protein